MKQKLTQNLNLKVLAVLFSIIIWVIVVNIDDPVKSVQFNDVPITAVNELVLTDKNEVYEIKDGIRTVDVTVSGRRSVIEDLSKENLIATIDLKEISDQDTVKIKVSTNKYSGDIDSIKPEFDTVELNIEDLERVQKAIQVETIGEPADGYIQGNYSLSLNQVRVEGPKSIVDSIAGAKVQIDVEGATNSMSASSPIILYNVVGEKVDTTRLNLNIDSVNISQEILFTKVVYVACNAGGTPEKGYKLTGETEILPGQVVIAGPKNTVDSISQITIPSTVVNVEGEKSDYKTTINLNNYLPDNVEIITEGFNGIASITVDIEEEISKKYNIYLNKVVMENLPSDLEAEFVDGALSATDNRVEIEVWGLEKELNKVAAADITIKVDFDDYLESRKLSELREGTYEVPATIILPNDLRCEDDVKLRVVVTKK